MSKEELVGKKPSEDDIKSVDAKNIVSGINPKEYVEPEVEGQSFIETITCYNCGSANILLGPNKYFECWSCGSVNWKL